MTELKDGAGTGENQGEPLLKQIPEDFGVAEVLHPAEWFPLSAQWRYAVLRKRLFTTFEAIELVADHLGMEPKLVAYAGLKDEDAVTTQYLTMPSAAVAGLPGNVTEHILYSRDGREIRLTVGRPAAEPLRVGHLLGNTFNITLRRLTTEARDWWPESHVRTFLFINYYDTQRFGVPNGTVTTHLIGRALLDRDYSRALDLLRQSGAPEAESALAHSGSAQDFFARLDQRRVAFYQSAHFSYVWNAELKRLIADYGDVQSMRRRGIEYYFCHSARELIHSTARLPTELPYVTVRATNADLQRSSRQRTTIVQARADIQGLNDDDLNPGFFRSKVSLFLPSGCYATMAVSQLCHQMRGLQ
jgi:tRNA pseudouridine13 synthase